MKSFAQRTLDYTVYTGIYNHATVQKRYLASDHLIHLWIRLHIKGNIAVTQQKPIVFGNISEIVPQISHTRWSKVGLRLYFLTASLLCPGLSIINCSLTPLLYKDVANVLFPEWLEKFPDKPASVHIVFTSVDSLFPPTTWLEKRGIVPPMGTCKLIYIDVLWIIQLTIKAANL